MVMVKMFVSDNLMKKTVLIDGKKMSNAISALDVSIRPGQLPEVHIKACVKQVSMSMENCNTDISNIWEIAQLMTKQDFEELERVMKVLNKI